MNARFTATRMTRHLGLVVAAAATLLASPIAAPVASAAPCADVEVVFARGTGEPPGVGGVGQAFVDALRARVGTKTVDVYPVDYAASGDFNDGIAFAETVVAGIRNEGDHIQATAANCPATKIVLGGYSQGAVVTGFTTADSAPPGVPAIALPAPLPPAIADHVAAVALFGTPSPQFLQSYGAPEITLGSRYAPKTTEQCAQGDTICDGTPNATPTVAHTLYPVNGMVGAAADYAADRVGR